ncbi:MAG: hypothetical protein GX896_09955 [Clostridiales bacterium]|nr:hypothetical protein [Clostridiales bacterium]
MRRITGTVELDFRGPKVFNLEKFESIEELDRWINTTKLNVPFRYARLASKEGTYYFTKTESYEEARELLVNGWEEKAKDLTKKLNSKPIMNDTRNKMVYDVVGFQPSVPRYLQGIPQNMFNSKKIATKKTKILNVVKLISYVSHTPADKIEEESVKALRIVQLLEQQGFKCNLYVHCMTESDGRVPAFELKLKNAADRLNISKVAFPLVHPSFLRRINFAWAERSEIITKGHVHGYGRPINGSEEQRYIESLKKNQGYKNTLFISSFISESEEEYIEKNLKNI